MAIQIPPRPTELAQLLGTADPHQQATMVRTLQAQATAELAVLTILADSRTDNLALTCTGRDLEVEEAIMLLRRAIDQLERQ